jgi:hypothetical protein
MLHIASPERCGQTTVIRIFYLPHFGVEHEDWLSEMSLVFHFTLPQGVWLANDTVYRHFVFKTND